MPIRYISYGKVIDRFGDFIFSVSHKTLRENLAWDNKLSIVIPSNSHSGRYYDNQISTCSFNYIFSSRILIKNIKHGYYSNLFLRVSGDRKQTYILDYNGSTHYENWQFTTNNGTFAAIDINAYVSPFKSLSWHFGFFTYYNSDGRNKAECYTSWNEQTTSFEPMSNENGFIDIGFKTAIVSKIHKTDIKISTCFNPLIVGSQITGLWTNSLSFNIYLSRKFSYVK